jgi:hypothetical protein
MMLTAYATVSLALLVLYDLDTWEHIFWKRPPVFASPFAPTPPDAAELVAVEQQEQHC